jgi:hypothetical protein
VDVNLLQVCPEWQNFIDLVTCLVLLMLASQVNINIGQFTDDLSVLKLEDYPDYKTFTFIRSGVGVNMASSTSP